MRGLKQSASYRDISTQKPHLFGHCTCSSVDDIYSGLGRCSDGFNLLAGGVALLQGQCGVRTPESGHRSIKQCNKLRTATTATITKPRGTTELACYLDLAVSLNDLVGNQPRYNTLIWTIGSTTYERCCAPPPHQQAAEETVRVTLSHQQYFGT